jgi:hypothetical protein
LFLSLSRKQCFKNFIEITLEHPKLKPLPDAIFGGQAWMLTSNVLHDPVYPASQ